MKDRTKEERLKDRSKESLKLLAALCLRDDYAKRKIVRRLVPVLVLVASFSAGPSFAKQVTDEELAAFLAGKPSPVAAAPAPAAALTSREGEMKTRPAAETKAAKAEDKNAPRPGRVVVDPKTKKRSYVPPSAPVLPKDAKTVETRISGTVGVKILPGMSLTYGADPGKGSSQEIWIDFHDGIRLSGAKTFQDFGEGDQVEATVVETEDHTKRLVTELKMLHHVSDAERKRAADAEKMAEESGVQSTEEAAR